MNVVRVGEAATILGISPTRVRSLCDRGVLPCLVRSTPLAKRIWDRALVEQYAAMGTPVRKARVPEALRIWRRVEQRGDGCWTVVEGVNANGYGVAVGGSTHTVMYEAAKGPVPAGLQLDHLCRNRACCNPDHLEAVTRRENLIRGVGFAGMNIRKTHCKWGHEFTPENTHRVPAGRACRRCHADREAARRARLRAAQRQDVAA